MTDDCYVPLCGEDTSWSSAGYLVKVIFAIHGTIFSDCPLNRIK